MKFDGNIAEVSIQMFKELFKVQNKRKHTSFSPKRLIEAYNPRGKRTNKPFN